jgi:2-methylcitrate dehydratase
MDKTTEMLCSYILSVDYGALSTDTIHETKRRILDSLGCALAGFDSAPARIARQVASTMQSVEPARILGENIATTADLAAFANTVMIRYLDCNDSFVSAGGGHPSDMLPAVLAAGEIAGRSGKDMVSALVVAYEVYGRFAQACAIRDRGWDQGIFISLGSACAVGKLLGLSREQLGHAVSLAAVANVPLGQTRVGELSMWKGCATAAAVRHGVFSALLALGGMEGPFSPFEGRFGLFEQVTGVLDLGEFADSTNRFQSKISETSIKYFPTQIHTQAAAAMALDLRADCVLADIEEIRIETYRVAVRNSAGEPEKWDPGTRETADHSLPYVVAVALTDGAITPRSFSESKLRDPGLRPLMRKVEVCEDAHFTHDYPAKQGARMEIRLRSGRSLSAETSHPKGHFENPLNDGELEAKFRGLLAGILSEAKQDELLARVWQFDDLQNLDPIFAAAAKEEERKAHGA